MDPLPLEIGHYYKYNPADIITGPRGRSAANYTNNVNNFLYAHRDDIIYFRVDNFNSYESYITVFFRDGTHTNRIAGQPGYLNQLLYIDRNDFRGYPRNGSPAREYFKDMEIEMAQEVYNKKTNNNASLNKGPTSIIANFLRKGGRGGKKKRKTRRKLSRK